MGLLSTSLILIADLVFGSIDYGYDIALMFNIITTSNSTESTSSDHPAVSDSQYSVSRASCQRHNVNYNNYDVLLTPINEERKTVQILGDEICTTRLQYCDMRVSTVSLDSMAQLALDISNWQSCHSAGVGLPSCFLL